MIHKLKYKFVIIAMASSLTVLLVVLGTINSVFWKHSLNMADDLLVFLADHDGGFPAWNGEFEAPQPTGAENDGLSQDSSEVSPPFQPMGFPMNQETAFRTRCFSVIFDLEGNILNTRMDRIAAITEDEAVLHARKVLSAQRERGFDGIYRFYVEYRESEIYVGFLDCNDVLQSIRTLVYISCAILAFCLVATFILVLILSGRAIRPVVASMERQKQFIADAGHEIKTPLTIISANAAVLAMTGGENEWTESIRNQTRRLDGLVRQLLDLSRVEADVPLPMAVFSISDAALDITGAFAPLVASQDKHLAVEIQPNIEMHGNEESLRRLISILMDNAVKYTPEGGNIQFSLKKSSRVLHIASQNTCVPMESAHLEKLFERFYRVDASRNRETGGYGIGLSIAREIVSKHRGKIRVRCPAPDVIVFSIALPLQNHSAKKAL